MFHQETFLTQQVISTWPGSCCWHTVHIFLITNTHNFIANSYFHSIIFRWYVGKITREKAEDLLQKCAVGTFLVRDSESVQKAGAYTLTLK